MPLTRSSFPRLPHLLAGALALCAAVAHGALAPVVTTTNTTVRVMAANTTSGTQQAYEAPGIRIFQGLKPDIVAVQEFSYLTDSATDLRAFVNTAFGTNFTYFRESGYPSIPNGIISRWPILASGSWDDPQVGDRGFAWARVDVPGTNDLYVVSVHLHSGGGPTSRATEATVLKGLIQSNFPANAWVILAGDLNTDSRTEACLTTFKTFLSDSPVPTDAATGGNEDTNAGRDKPYDHVLPSFSLTNTQIPVVIGAQSFSKGLVFDSRIFTPLTAVAPVQSGDSGVSGMQHMAVVKDFRVTHTVTNFVDVPAPVIRPAAGNVLRWTGPSNVPFTVQASTNLSNWITAATVSSTTTNLAYTNTVPANPRRFLRVAYP